MADTNKAAKSKDVPAHVKEARKQAAQRLLKEEVGADRNARILQRLQSDDRHPATAETAAVALEQSREAKTKTDDVIRQAGLKRAELESNKADRRAELSDLVLQWKMQRDLHQDYLDNPEAYGGVDVGGTPIDAEVQARMVAEYDAAIAVAEEEKDALS